MSSEGGLQPIVCFQPARSVEKVLFLAVSPGGLFFGCIARFWSLTVLYVSCCFSSGLWSWLSWLCDQGVIQDGNSSTVECNCGLAGFYRARLVPAVGYHLLMRHSRPTRYNGEVPNNIIQYKYFLLISF